MNDLYFQVADADFHLVYKNQDDVRQLLPSYAPFHLPAGSTESCLFTMTVGDGLVPHQQQGKEIGHFDSGDAIHTVCLLDDGGYLILINDHTDRPTCALRTSSDFSINTATLSGSDDERAYGLNNALMIAYAFSGAHHHRLLMHASVPMKDGYAYLFLGKSGTGKSTHSRLWLQHIPGTDLLNDDNPVVRYDETDHSVSVYGTPWSGKTPCYRNLRMKAGGFLRLQQYPENILRKLSKVEAFATILSSCSTMIWDKPSYDGICDTVSQIAGLTPAYHLQCLPDQAAAELSYSHLGRTAAPASLLQP